MYSNAYFYFPKDFNLSIKISFLSLWHICKLFQSFCSTVTVGIVDEISAIYKINKMHLNKKHKDPKDAKIHIKNRLQ